MSHPPRRYSVFPGLAFHAFPKSLKPIQSRTKMPNSEGRGTTKTPSPFITDQTVFILSAPSYPWPPTPFFSSYFNRSAHVFWMIRPSDAAAYPTFLSKMSHEGCLAGWASEGVVPSEPGRHLCEMVTGRFKSAEVHRRDMGYQGGEVLD